MEELLSLKWNNHRSTFIQVLGILRDKQLFTDATIACDGKFYSVHKLVLSTCSDYFSAMLDRTNCKNPVIVLKDIKSEDLEALLDYMYLGEVNVRQSDLATLIKAAECLRVKGLAVPDDEPLQRKSRGDTQSSRRGDTSGSPPAKRKRRSDVDDGRDDVRPIGGSAGRQSSPHQPPPPPPPPPVSRPKSPSVSNTTSVPVTTPSTTTPLSPLPNRSTPQRQPTTDASIPVSPTKISQHDPDENTETALQNNQGYSSDHAEPFVKVEMDDGGTGGADVETYDPNNDGFKEEDAAGSGGDMSNDLPEFLQQATSGPLQGGAFGHSSFSSASSFQPGELPGWQGDGSNIGFPHLNFTSTEGSSQQNAPGASSSGSSYSGNTSGGGGLSSRPSLVITGIKSLSQHTTGTTTTTTTTSSSSPSLNSPDCAALPALACPMCGKLVHGRNRRQNMENHMLIHSGLRPHKCPECSYSSTQLGNLRRHKRSVHKIYQECDLPLVIGTYPAEYYWSEQFKNSLDTAPLNCDGPDVKGSYGPDFIEAVHEMNVGSSESTGIIPEHESGDGN